MSAYEEGQVVRAKATFKNADGDPVDPTVVKFRILDPGSAVAEYIYPEDPALVKESTGVYYFDLLLTDGGLWKYRWLSSGVGATSKTVSLNVTEVEF